MAPTNWTLLWTTSVIMGWTFVIDPLITSNPSYQETPNQNNSNTLNNIINW